MSKREIESTFSELNIGFHTKDHLNLSANSMFIGKILFDIDLESIVSLIKFQKKNEPGPRK